MYCKSHERRCIRPPRILVLPGDTVRYRVTVLIATALVLTGVLCVAPTVRIAENVMAGTRVLAFALTHPQRAEQPPAGSINGQCGQSGTRIDR